MSEGLKEQFDEIVREPGCPGGGPREVVKMEQIIADFGL